MNNGWIKLHRKILNNNIFINSGLLQLFLYFLLSANHKDKYVYGILVKRGELLTGRKRLAMELNQKQSTIYKRMQRLMKRNMIGIKSNNKHTIVSICNYETYQEQVTTDEQESNSKVTTDEQQSNTNKKLRSKEGKNNTTPYSPPKGGKSGKPLWKTDYDEYKKIVNTALNDILHDREEMQKQQKFNPNLNIKLSLEKSVHNFWGTEAGWKHKKKKSRAKEIDMRRTLINNIDKNKVWKSKNQSIESLTGSRLNPEKEKEIQKEIEQIKRSYNCDRQQ